MTLERPFRISMLALVLTGMLAVTLALGSVLWLLGSAAAFVAIVVCAWLRPGWHLRRGVATVAVIIATQAVVIEWITTHSVLVPAAHFLIVTQLTWLTQERTNRNWGWLCVVSLLQIMLAGVLSVDLAFGLCFLAYLPAGVSALLFYNLRCELERHGGLKPSKMPRIGLRFLAGAGVVAAAEIVLSIAIFMHFPRFGIQILQLKPVQRGERLSGFSDTVRFGDLVRILDNPRVVMSVQLRKDGKPIQADRFRLLLRGIALDTYQHATWTTRHYIADSNRHMLPYRKRTSREEEADLIVQDITLQPIDTRVLFYLPEVMHFDRRTPNLDDVLYHRASGTFSSQRSNSMSLRYVVRSRMNAWPAELLHRPAKKPLTEIRHGRLFRNYDPSGRFSQLPSSIGPRTRALAETIVAGIPREQVYERAVRIESYLKGRYDYDLNAGVRTWGVDPIEDFLHRTKAGHCEHFAASMAVLLRCLDVPARVVTGFSGGEWNEYGEFYVIRQRNAHAWVEARVPSVSDRVAIAPEFGNDWATFDPTPPVITAPTLEHGWVAGFSGRLAYLRLWWNNNVVNFSSGDQARLAGAVTAALSRLPNYLPLWGRDRLAVGSGYAAGVGAAILLGGLLVVVGMYLGVTRLLGLRWALPWLRRGRRPGEPREGFYRRLLVLLRRRGFRREPSVTPREFARAVIARGGERYRSVETVTEAFCRVRYGGERLTAADRAAVHGALTELEAAKR